MSIANILKKLNSRNTILLPKFTKKNKFIFVLITFIYITLLSQQIFASLSPETVDAFIKKQEAFKNKNNQESWMNESASSNIMILTNALVGDIPEKILSGDNKDTTDDYVWRPGGIVGLTSQGIAFLYTPPFSGVQYLANTFNSFLGKPAYASVSGYQGLMTLIPLWKGFRNITYAIFSLIFIITGIMIMLRVKISQQAVITIQSAIPKLITSLILVTFSYAIVGLLIDFSYLVEALGISIILQASGSHESIFEIISSPNVLERLFSLTPVLGIAIISGVIAGSLALFVKVTGWKLSVFAFILIFFGFCLVIMWYTLTFFFNLLKCYINILIKTILGPLEIALGSIPNIKIGFSSWFIDIIANILVFPISMIFLVMAKTLMEAVKNSNNLWTPNGLELFSGGDLLSIAIGIGSLALVSKLPKMIPEFIFQIKPSPWGKAIGEGLNNNAFTGALGKGRNLVANQAGNAETRLGKGIAAVGARVGLTVLPDGSNPLNDLVKEVMGGDNKGKK